MLAADAVPPVVDLSVPVYASDRSRSTRFPLRWSGTDRGTGISRYTLEVMRHGLTDGRWRKVASGTTRRRAVFRGRPDTTYVFRLRARDAAGNLSRYAYGQTVVPLDERSVRVQRSPGWRRVTRKAAYGRTMLRARRAGAELALPFEGQSVALIGRRTRRGARLSITLAGRTRVVSLRGKGAFRRPVFRSQELRPGRHVLRVRTLDRGVADIDAFAVRSGPPAPRR